MKISVITVTYNCVNTIERTIESVLNQKYYDLEYIIIDGDSTDGTKDIISKYKGMISCFISEPDDGVYNAMNKGLRNASGDLINFLNGDDYFYSNEVLHRVDEYFKSHSSSDILIGKDYLGIASNCHYKSRYKDFYADAIFPHQAIFAKREVFDRFGGFDEGYHICADREWLFRAMFNGFKVDFIDDVFVYFDANGLSNQSVLTTIEQYLTSEKYLLLSGKEELLPFTRRFAAYNYARWYVNSKLKNHDEVVTLLLKKIVGNQFMIWGGGYDGKSILNSCADASIHISMVIDNCIDDKELLGVPVRKYSKNIIQDFLLITSSRYENEIANILMNDDFEDGKDFIKMSSFLKKMICSMQEDVHKDGIFEKMTGFDLFQYL